jgi:hypothetical protein
MTQEFPSAEMHGGDEEFVNRLAITRYGFGMNDYISG